MILKFFSRMGFRGGLCEQFEQAADELTREAKTLKAYIDHYKGSPDPFGSAISSMWNNRQWLKFVHEPVDGGNGSGVGTRPIDKAHRAVR